MNKSNWERVTACPECGGYLTICDFYTLSLDRTITKKGVLSKRYSWSDPGPIDCTTAFCHECGTAFDADAVHVESDGSVWIKCSPEDGEQE